MSTSTHVIGFKPPDEKWLQMKAVRDSCISAKVNIPQVVDDFFNNDDPDELGVEVELPTHAWSDDCREGFEVIVSEIPSDVKVIRCYTSY